MVGYAMLVSKIRHVVCGMSGGLDSAVAALLLKRKGYDITGVFMTNWDIIDETSECTIDRDREDAYNVCAKLDIPLKEVNFVKEYWNNVFLPLVQGYDQGRVPNPDVLCNRYIKFNSFFDHAVKNLHADAVATGHYARSSYGDFLENQDLDTDAKLLLPTDTWKDQTLFLSQIPQRALRHTMFPVGSLEKREVRQLAIDAGLEYIAKKRESAGICFIGRRKFSKFIQDYVIATPGRFISIETGKVIGSHAGYQFYSRGQRCNIRNKGVAHYVTDIDPSTGDILTAPGTSHPALFARTMTMGPVQWISGRPPADFQPGRDFPCRFRYQHVHPLHRAVVTPGPADDVTQGCDDVRHVLSLEKPARGINAGQYAVLYRGEQCLGSACIVDHKPTLWDEGIQQPIRDAIS